MRFRARAAARQTSIALASFMTLLGVTILGGVAGAAESVPAADAARLRAIGIAVAVPAYVPPEFHLIRVDARGCPHDAQGHRYRCKYGPSYALHYAKDARSSFVIEETGGGIGDTGRDYRTTVHTRLFGPVTLYFETGQTGKGFGAMKPSPPALLLAYQESLISDWAGNGPFYHIIGNWMKPADVAKILASLRWLR